jgi:uncharacterized protein (TIGR02268 family)
MCHLLLLRSTALVLVLAASVAVARVREPVERTLILSEHPSTEAHKVYVGGRISTVLRFEKPCDPERTKLLAWEGHFEPLMCGGRSVVLYPLRDLTPEDRFMLLVTLSDGTEIPFIVTAHQQTYNERESDQQVNVFADREGYDAVLASLYRALKSERELREENERYRKEETSIDHAYATLLAKGVEKQAPFLKEKTIILEDGDVAVTINLFSGKGKAAALVRLSNMDSDKPWRFGEARLTSDQTSRTDRPFALRMTQAEIVPGASGTFVVVVDQSAFASEQGLVDLTLEIFRNDGLQQVVVLLDHRLIRE